MEDFACALRWVKPIMAHGWETFPKCEAKLGYHLILGPLFWECPYLGAFTLHVIVFCNKKGIQQLCLVGTGLPNNKAKRISEGWCHISNLHMQIESCQCEFCQPNVPKENSTYATPFAMPILPPIHRGNVHSPPIESVASK